MGYALNNVVLVSPGGNDTALVFDPISREQYADINSYLLKRFPNIEQVMFVRENENGTYGNMAGNEFCGNAVRSLGFFLLGGKEGTVVVKTSGTSRPLRVTVGSNHAKSDIPILDNWESVETLSKTKSIVHMEGITHVVCCTADDLAKRMTLADAETKKKIIMEMIKNYGLHRNPCVGLILVEEKAEIISITPYVYVKKTGTFYEETACGSGSVACVLKYAKEEKRSKTLSILQPSGAQFRVEVTINGFGFEKATLGGPVSVLYQGRVEI